MNKLKYTAIDYFYMFRGQVGPVRRRRRPAHYLQGEGRDIVLIPGLYEKWHFLRPLGNYLSPKGFRVHVTPGLGRNRRPIAVQARRLHDYLVANNIRDAVIVAHSKGGLIGLHYLIHHNADHRVGKVIAIAAPFSGSHIGRYARLRAIRELLPASDSIKALRSKKVYSRVVSIYPEYDNHVWHADGSFLDGAKNIVHPVKGHHKILFDKALLDIVAQEL